MYLPQTCISLNDGRRVYDGRVLAIFWPLFHTKKKSEYFGTFSVISVVTETSRNDPSFGTDTDTENVPEYTGKNVPVFPVHFPEIIPNSNTVTETHGLIS